MTDDQAGGRRTFARLKDAFNWDLFIICPNNQKKDVRQTSFSSEKPDSTKASADEPHESQETPPATGVTRERRAT